MDLLHSFSFSCTRCLHISPPSVSNTLFNSIPNIITEKNHKLLFPLENIVVHIGYRKWPANKCKQNVALSLIFREKNFHLCNYNLIERSSSSRRRQREKAATRAMVFSYFSREKTSEEKSTPSIRQAATPSLCALFVRFCFVLFHCLLFTL